MRVTLAVGLTAHIEGGSSVILLKECQVQKGKRAGEFREEFMGAYPNLSTAAQAALRKKLADSDATVSITALIEALEQASDKIAAACEFATTKSLAECVGECSTIPEGLLDDLFATDEVTP